MNGFTPLMFAVATRAVDAVRLLIERGAAVDVCDCRGAPVLHYAYPHEDTMRVLIEAGADVDAALPRTLRTCLHRAVRDNQGSVVQLLLLFGARCDIADVHTVLPAQMTVPQSISGALVFAIEQSHTPAEKRACNAVKALNRAKLLLIRERAIEICVALQNFRLPAWITVQIVDCACELARFVPLYLKWDLVVTTKHFC